MMSNKQSTRHKSTELNEKNRIDASIQLWIVRHLRVLSYPSHPFLIRTPHDLSRFRDQTEVAHIHLDDGSLRDHAQL